MVQLDVPLWEQATAHYCVPTCVKMVLEYIKLNHSIKRMLQLPVNRIAKIVETTKFGTIPGNVQKLNKYLENAIPSVEFRAELNRRFTEVIKELDERRPVILWINSVNPPDYLWHAVVVTGFDPHCNSVAFNDPDDKSANKHLEIGVFINKWGRQARFVKVLIGRKRQGYISEWIKRREKEEGESGGKG